MNARTRLAYVTCFVLWGSTWSVIKLGLRDLPPLLFAGSRMLLGAAVLLPFALRAGLRSFPRRAMPELALIGLLQIGIPYALMFVGQQWVPSALAAILFATFPVWLVVVARLMLPGQPLTPRKLGAAALGLCGVAVLQGRSLGGALGPRAPLGALFVVLAAVAVAIANVLVRKRLSAREPMVIAFGQILVGGVFLLALSAPQEPWRASGFTPLAISALLYLAVFCTALTYLCFFWLIQRVPMSAVGAIPLLDTTVAVLLGTLLLHERVGLSLLAGGALVLCGTALATREGPAPAATATEGA